jgi:hypothetical protein
LATGLSGSDRRLLEAGSDGSQEQNEMARRLSLKGAMTKKELATPIRYASPPIAPLWIKEAKGRGGRGDVANRCVLVLGGKAKEDLGARFPALADAALLSWCTKTERITDARCVAVQPGISQARGSWLCTPIGGSMP